MKNKLLFGFFVVRNSFLSQYTYRWQVLSKIVYGILLYVTQLFIWKSVNASVPKPIYNWETMSVYVMLSSIIGVFVAFDTNYIPVIGERVRSGDIALDLLKPCAMFYLLFCQYLGKCLFKFLFQFISQFLVILIISRAAFSIPLVNVAFFSVSVFLSILLFFALSMVLGILSFWVVSVGNLHIFLDSSITLFAGSIIPIWMIPEQLRWFYEILPFQYLFYKPISICLNTIELSNVCLIYAIQVGWIVALLAIAAVLYQRGIKKLTLFGV